MTCVTINYLYPKLYLGMSQFTPITPIIPFTNFTPGCHNLPQLPKLYPGMSQFTPITPNFTPGCHNLPQYPKLYPGMSQVTPITPNSTPPRDATIYPRPGAFNITSKTALKMNIAARPFMVTARSFATAQMEPFLDPKSGNSMIIIYGLDPFL